jgi:inorganic triphosphatase YgiF
MTTLTEPGPTELEIKFLLPVGAEDTLTAHPVLGRAHAGPWTTQKEATTYFDTSNRALARSGASLRVRHSQGRHVQTLKLHSGRNAFSRGEWEWPLANDRPDAHVLSDTPLAKFVETADDLVPVFRTEISRSLQVLHSDDAIIEATLDLGSITAGEKVEPIRELELELKEGAPAALYLLAERLQTTLPLVLGAESKSDRGWRLVNGRPIKEAKQAKLHLAADVTGTAAFRILVQSALASLLANQPAAATGLVEGVHQMRIAIRRLRACLALFRPHLDRDAERRHANELRRLGQVLGTARDWDVFCTQTLPDAAKSGVAEHCITSLLAKAELERTRAHERLAAELASPALTKTVLGMSAWVEAPRSLSGPADGDALSKPLLDLAAKLEARLKRKMHRCGRRIRHRSEEELHDLRKALKKLRYSVEFLAPLHREDQVKFYLHHCKQLQERLGGINDAATAVTMAERLGAQDASLALVAGAVTDWANQHRMQAVAHLPAAWHEFKDAAFPRISASSTG